MMKRILSNGLQLVSALIVICFAFEATAQPRIKINQENLMNEMRATPFPLNAAVIINKKVAFMWPLLGKGNAGSVLDGVSDTSTKKPDPNAVNYKIRISKNKKFKKGTITAETSWAFYNPAVEMESGLWYWQYAYVDKGKTTWSKTLRFTLKNGTAKFSTPTFEDLIAKLPKTHPRVWAQQNTWDTFIKNSVGKEERGWYLDKANQLLKTKILHISNTIDTSKVAELNDKLKQKAMLIRESRRVVDKEEANTEVLIRSYLLTKDERYFKAAMDRVKEIISWRNSGLLAGDFNQSTLLSLSSMAYDSFYNILSKDQKRLLLAEIKENGNSFFEEFANHLEAHIADNHSVQMTLRILTMAAFSAYGELPEAAKWADYCYNLWIARFPGVNNDGGWHNGDSYFHVNIRTLVEVPYFYSQLSGYDFFSDPWYRGSAMYVIYQQPPFSKSGGNGSSHQNVVKPNGTRVGYADAIAKLTNNTYLADYVNVIRKEEPNILKTGFMAKPGDLSWFRLQSDKTLPKGKGLKDLSLSYVFPNTGLASVMSNWGNIKQSAMLSFRSSPYGSTSHALANQNAFNTFYAGKPLFYSSGHHTSFIDEHGVYSHRSTRAHNSILANGMGQKIGTEGYGWMPRYYNGEKISYFLGDASNAYGKVASPLWLERGRLSKLEYSPKNGWDTNHVKTFRRHIVSLGGADLVFIYDELEADSAITWSYLLHSIENPMTVANDKDFVHVQANNLNGISDAYLFSKDKLKTTQTDKFFVPAINWLKSDDNGVFKPYKNHWHFTATTPNSKVYRFATVISTHSKDGKAITPKYIDANTIEVDNWIIKVNLAVTGKATFAIKNTKEPLSVIYDGTTVIKENGKTVSLKDQLPELEI
ncbi:DUF4962 domain-containing protein [Pedobacter arcticus]|uniref:DUF4962 domain-containing protein n=1 Tax=Pedobacter arcticus TaxID=752140 RepID=UPI0002FEABB5|nr:DUF4962 domain-containing protein [Pedobacter arcticus]